MDEKLKKLLGDELFTSISNALKGKGKDGKDMQLIASSEGDYIPKQKFNELLEAKTKAENETIALTAVQKKLDELAKKLDLVPKEPTGSKTDKTDKTDKADYSLVFKGLEEKLVGFDAKIAEALEQNDKKHFETRRDEYIISQLQAKRAYNPSDLMPKLKLDEIKYENNKWHGIDEQIDKAKKESGYLFQPEEEKRKGSAPIQASPNVGTDKDIGSTFDFNFQKINTINNKKE